MTDAQKIEEEAIIDAKDDFELLAEWLEARKKEVQEWHLKNPDRLMAAITLLSAGIFIGNRSQSKISHLLVGFLSGAVTAYGGVNLIMSIRKSRKGKKAEPAAKVEHKAPDEPKKTVSEPEEPRQLKNVKIFEPGE